MSHAKFLGLIEAHQGSLGLTKIVKARWAQIFNINKMAGKNTQKSAHFAKTRGSFKCPLSDRSNKKNNSRNSKFFYHKLMTTSHLFKNRFYFFDLKTGSTENILRPPIIFFETP